MIGRLASFALRAGAGGIAMRRCVETGVPTESAVSGCVVALGMAVLTWMGLGWGCVAQAQQASVMLPKPGSMARLGSVDARYASYNIEMVQVTGGRFWKPYASASSSMKAETQKAPPTQPGRQSAPPGMSASLYEYRSPIHLDNARLVRLAKALGPSYVRVSGTWANRTWFQDDDQPARTSPPEGFGSVLTRAEWKGVLQFVQATGGSLVTSVAVSAGVRNAQGVWMPEQAQALWAYTRREGGQVAATEFMNEPTFPTISGVPVHYDAAEFARDAKLFGAFLRKNSPGTIYLGPGSVGEGSNLMPPGMQMKLMPTDAILQATGPLFDAFSYHFYGAASRRCMGRTTVEQAMSDAWLDDTLGAEKFYAALRDQYMPGRPLWVTETAEAACGGDPFSGQFVDVFRYLNQLGALAQKGVQVVMHNTLSASDYGLLDEQTLEPKPDYWATLLWKRNMGRTVLQPGVAAQAGVHIYAHCAVQGKGAVTVMVLNSRASALTLELPVAAEQATLTAAKLTSRNTEMNGILLQAADDGTVRLPAPERIRGGRVTLPGKSATFLSFPRAGNSACR